MRLTFTEFWVRQVTRMVQAALPGVYLEHEGKITTITVEQANKLYTAVRFAYEYEQVKPNVRKYFGLVSKQVGFYVIEVNDTVAEISLWDERAT